MNNIRVAFKGKVFMWKTVFFSLVFCVVFSMESIALLPDVAFADTEQVTIEESAESSSSSVSEINTSGAGSSAQASASASADANHSSDSSVESLRFFFNSISSSSNSSSGSSGGSSAQASASASATASVSMQAGYYTSSQICSLDIVSDQTDMIAGDGYAVLTYNQHPAWTASISGAKWIWNTFLVANPGQDETVTFVKEFYVSSPAIMATLVVASDNSYSVSINGDVVGADPTESNFREEGKDTYSVLPYLHTGLNSISFTVKNWGLPGSTAQSNPAGLLYKLHIDLNATGCGNPPPPANKKPVITLLGGNPLDIVLGNTFTDPGATVYDPEDGDMTYKLVKSGAVDTSVLGTYAITYNATDTQNLAADTKTRTVNVVPPLPECFDGKDNDNDGKIDYPADTGCDNQSDNNENIKPFITVLPNNPYTLHIGDVFTDPGATAFDQEDGTITPKIITTGIVDVANAGTYTITYNATDTQNLAADTKTRTVNVVSNCSDGVDNDGDGNIDYPADTGCHNTNDDSENDTPILTLLGSVVMDIIVGHPFTDPGATATDTEDGDLTAKIVKTGAVNTDASGTYFLVYNVQDTQGLAAPTATRTVNVLSETPPGCTANCGGSDNTRPILTLKGGETMTIIQGTSFSDPGAMAYDAEDGDLTSRIVVGGSVDTATSGNYTLTYDVSDHSGLQAMQVKRTVSVVSGAGDGGGSGGGGVVPIILSIFNEKISITNATTAVITWNTNVPATSRVVFGLESKPTLGTEPLYGYQLANATDTALVLNHEMVIGSIPSGTSTYFRPVSTDGTRTVIGIELTRLPEEPVAACFLLQEYLRYGINNNPDEVTKLQSFLRDFEGFTTLRVTGLFDIETDKAVRSFQDKYKTEVLDPWNLPGNTGYVYYTTQKKINEIYCQRAFPLSEAQVLEIAAFRDLIKTMNERREAFAPAPGTPSSAPATGTSTQRDIPRGTTVEVSPIGEEEITPALPLVGVLPQQGSGSGEIGAVAGTSSETEGAIASGVATTNGALPERRGRIAITDILATIPNVGDKINGSTSTVNSVIAASTSSTTESIVNGKVNTMMRGIAAVVDSLSKRMQIPPLGLLVLFILLVVASVLVWKMIRRSEEENHTEDEDDDDEDEDDDEEEDDNEHEEYTSIAKEYAKNTANNSGKISPKSVP